MNGVEHAGADRQPGPGDSPAGAPAEQSLQELAKGDYRARDDLPDMPGYGLRCAIDQAHRGQAVTAVRFSPDGRSLASAGSDGTAAIWDTASGQLLQRLEAHKRGISGGRRQNASRTAARCSAPPTRGALLSSLCASTRTVQTLPGPPTAATWPPPRTTLLCACGTPPAGTACACWTPTTTLPSAAPGPRAATCWCAALHAGARTCCRDQTVLRAEAAGAVAPTPAGLPPNTSPPWCPPPPLVCRPARSAAALTRW